MMIQVKDGTIVNADKTIETDLWIENDKIVAVGDYSAKPDQVIDAKAQYVLPGGIDPHVHMSLPTPAGPSSDDFRSGSIAALHGGTTTMIDFVTPQKGQSLVTALEERMQEAASSLIDYSFHVSPTEWRDTTDQEIAQCVEMGITSFKIYMAYKNAVGLEDWEIKKVLESVARHGGWVIVHAEKGEEIDALRDKSAEEGYLSPAAHAQTRPDHTEADAVKKIIQMADEAGCPLYIVHVSTKKAIAHIEEAQQNGQLVVAETCPHYLLLDEAKYIGDFGETVKYVLSPPLRKKLDNEALWQAMANGVVSTVGTDHCPFTLAQKSAGKDDFRKIPNGAGGIEHRLPLLLTHTLHYNKLSATKLTDLISTQPAKIFGIFPQKGILQEGADADIVVWKPEGKHIISAETHHQNSDINIYEGTETRGTITHLLKKGETVIEQGKFTFPEIKGAFLGQ